jgi:5'-3' exonuclease
MECKRQLSSQFITNLDIRWYKNSDVYKKNTRHCIYGQDADLIMLSLLSHEPNFTIIREEVKYKREQVEGIVRNEFIITNNFQLLYLPLLREYLDMEFKSTIENMELEYNLERVIDDIIFFCFFVGNDFLPSLSVLDIAEASVDTLFDIYKVTLPEIGDYITENGLIYWDRAEKLIKALASHELEILHVRMQKIMNFEKRAEYQEAQFLKGEERIQYFRLKEKREELIHKKKKKLVDQLVKDSKDKDYKRDRVSKRPRELQRMQLGAKHHQKGLKKRRSFKKSHPTGNTKFNFEALMQNDEEEQDLDWLEDEDRGEGDQDDEEETAKIKSKEIAQKAEEEKSPENENQISKQSEEAIETTKEETVKEETANEEIAKEETVEETIETPKQYEGEEDGLSDLGVHDINDSDVSDIDLEEIAEIEGQVEGALSRDLIVQLKIAEESRRKNQDFVKNLCLRYKENPESAKAYYYKEKVDFDVYVESGKNNRDEMLRQYLVGMQWVMFYYYRGVQHWGFYYKYHYPPMISDIKDIESLLGSTVIETFD